MSAVLLVILAAASGESRPFGQSIRVETLALLSLCTGQAEVTRSPKTVAFTGACLHVPEVAPEPAPLGRPASPELGRPALLLTLLDLPPPRRA